MSVSIADLVAQMLHEEEPKVKGSSSQSICPCCHKEPRVVSAKGNKGPYCKQCAKNKMKIYRNKRAI